MNERAEGTHEQPTDGAAPLAAGAPVPGLSSWVLERKLGGGGFGEVWLARHAWSAKEPPRAVKFCTDPVARHRLVTHEKNVVLRVMRFAGNHPHVVPLLECNLDGGVPWLMYQFVEGGTLADAMAQWRDLSHPKRLGRAVRTLYALAGALRVFHQLSPPLVHRDLKPQNVLMADGKVPRITDFGIGGVAPHDATAQGNATAFDARVPTGLQAAGSANYAPVEQRLGSPPDPRDDVHALGVIAYQLLVGDVNFAPGPDIKDELRELKVPSELIALVAQSVATNPDRRPKDAGVWESVLGELIQRAQKHSDSISLSTSGIGSLPVLPPDSLPTPAGPSAAPAPPVPLTGVGAPDPSAEAARVWVLLCALLVVALGAAVLYFAAS